MDSYHPADNQPGDLDEEPRVHHYTKPITLCAIITVIVVLGLAMLSAPQ